MNQRLKKVLKILGITAGVCVALAVVIGVLNALVANGTWSFGWTDYRYDESGYETGEGSVIASDVTTLSIDWIDGEVRIVSCQDQYISLSEDSPTELDEDSVLRYRVGENGTELSVRYRASSWYLGSGKNKNKTLTVRIPEEMFDSLEHISINGVSANITINGRSLSENESAACLSAQSMVLKSESGSIKVRDVSCTSLSITNQKGSVDFAGHVEKDLICTNKSGKTLLKLTNTCERIDVESTSGDVNLRLPDNTAFTLAVEHKKAIDLTIDFPYQTIDGKYVCGTGGTTIKITTAKGDVAVTR